MKPQREGGGNNFFGDDVRTQLETLTPDQLAGFVLMERINPPHRLATFMREGDVSHGTAVNECGIFSVFLGDGVTIHLSDVAGHLLRTKVLGADEGGVAAGYSALSSPLFSS